MSANTLKFDASAITAQTSELIGAGRVLQRVFNENQDVFWGAE